MQGERGAKEEVEGEEERAKEGLLEKKVKKENKEKKERKEEEGREN